MHSKNTKMQISVEQATATNTNYTCSLAKAA